VDGAARPSSAKDKVVAAMERLDRLAAELDDAIARLDEALPDATAREPSPGRRARWYWTAAAPDIAADADAGALAEASGPP
jgi:hypothetical protein